MNKESTSFGLSSNQLIRLLNIGSDTRSAAGKMGQEQEKEELLNDWLAASLPFEAAIVKSIPKVLRRLCRELRPLVGDSLGSLLRDPKANVSAIRKVKDYSKELVASATSEAEYEVATAIYYAAIASAFVYHNKKITKFSYESLRDSYSTLLEHGWLNADLSRLFKKARKACEKKAKRGKRRTVA